MYDADKIDNAAMHQKDTLIDMIDSDDFAQWDLALSFLRFLREMWAAINYSYKGRELCLRITQRIADLSVEDTLHWKRARKYEDYRAAAYALADLYGADEAEYKSKMFEAA